ncbi:DNA cytosine methyltransferase [Mycetocola zhadangensis]|uniref:Cytosine-specific methyltransferase n=1 Tax=Mycetocola zhadangensis TaxID=1164595 RepID=A0A3L7J147_9MICO|nr:DNA cytosine methyltransferase [Mycetocola zhadangensis]RLQ84109.1 DNA cytosine methyltransferase [Mycetocola zhadangensis]GGE96085.1 cytosine-specific methyltransferase [Mycetocola zhadangensis]
MSSNQLSAIEICAGAGGQSSGLELAGFGHELALEIDVDAAQTLRRNRPKWNVVTDDVRNLNGTDYRGIDLLAGGVPCPPFSLAGKQLGADDERDLFPEALRLVREAKPKAVMLENVKGLASARFAPYRAQILDELEHLGYESSWQLLFSSEFGVPQLRPRFILVALKRSKMKKFEWPRPVTAMSTVGDVLKPLMGANGWSGTERWAQNANGIAPTVVGGSKKHGGADLGPTRAKAAWLALGVDGKGIVDEAPTVDMPETHIPRLTNPMVARIQGFEPDWQFEGRKTSVYRQIGNAFPPPVACGVGAAIAAALGSKQAATEPAILRAAG